MAETGEIRYAKTADDLYVAYTAFGQGPPDVIFTPGGVSHLEVYEEYSPLVHWDERMSSFARFIVFDKRGTGLSDPVAQGHPPTLEERMDDVRAVMDAVGLERAGLLGFVEGNALAVLFAATYPDRVSALILYGAWMCFRWSEDYPWALRTEQIRALEASIETGADADFVASGVAPSVARDPNFRTWWSKLQRSGGTPTQRLAIYRMMSDIDVRPILASIRVPTLVLHRLNDELVPLEAGRWAASQIPGAKFAVLEGRDHLPFVGDFEDMAGEIEEFLTGTRREASSERVLATVLFVDIVGSTGRAVELGDTRWKRVLDDYERAVGRQLERFRGQLVKTLGDGSLAIFDGPARAIRGAIAIRDAVYGLGLEVRSGLHTGEIDRRAEDVSGIAVHLAQRVCACAAPREVLVSRTVVDLVAGSGIQFDDRGEHELKGVPEPVRLLAVRT